MKKIIRFFNMRQLAVVLIIVIVPLFAWLSVKANDEVVNSRAWLEHTYNVLQALHDVRGELDTLEIGRKGYFIRRHAEHLMQISQVRHNIPTKLDVLRGMTADNAYQQERLSQLQEALGLLLEETTGNIADLDAQNIPYTEYSDKASPLFERARVALGEMHAHEDALLKSRLSNSASKQLNLDLVLLFIGVSFLALLGFVLTNMYRELRQRRKVEAGLLKSQMQNQMTVHNLSLMGELSSLLQACTSIEESLDVIRQFAVQLLNVDAGAIYLYRESRNQVEEKASWGGAP